MKSCHMFMQLSPHTPLAPAWLIYRIFYVKLYILSIPLSAPHTSSALAAFGVCIRWWWKRFRYLHRISQQGARWGASWDYDCLNIDSSGAFFAVVKFVYALLAVSPSPLKSGNQSRFKPQACQKGANWTTVNRILLFSEIYSSRLGC